MPKINVMMDCISVDDLTLATSLLCQEGAVLVDKEITGKDRNGLPLCSFIIGHPTPGFLEDLATKHRESEDGLMVGSKRYDLKRATVIAPAVREVRGSR